MTDRVIPRFDASHQEVVEATLGDIGDFDPSVLGFSKTRTVEGDESLTYESYSGLADLAVGAFLKHFPDRVIVDSEQRIWVEELDVMGIMNVGLRLLRDKGFINVNPGALDG